MCHKNVKQDFGQKGHWAQLTSTRVGRERFACQVSTGEATVRNRSDPSSHLPWANPAGCFHLKSHYSSSCQTQKETQYSKEGMSMLKQFTKSKLPADNKTSHQNFRTQYQPHFSLLVGALDTAVWYQNDFFWYLTLWWWTGYHKYHLTSLTDLHYTPRHIYKILLYKDTKGKLGS